MTVDTDMYVALTWNSILNVLMIYPMKVLILRLQCHILPAYMNVNIVKWYDKTRMNRFFQVSLLLQCHRQFIFLPGVKDSCLHVSATVHRTLLSWVIWSFDLIRTASWFSPRWSSFANMLLFELVTFNLFNLHIVDWNINYKLLFRTKKNDTE
jgi:uncharacterized membrane protein